MNNKLCIEKAVSDLNCTALTEGEGAHMFHKSLLKHKGNKGWGFPLSSNISAFLPIFQAVASQDAKKLHLTTTT